jgi:hypothetical protein
MWTLARYEPTGLFSLRPALSTASGAQSLLVPTPFAVKMALLDVAIHLYGVEQGAAWWPDMRDLAVALALPDALVVNKTFIKIQRPTRVTKGNAEEVAEAKAAGIYPLGPTIAFREFVQFSGMLGVAVQSRSPIAALPLARLLAHITYLGKRGGFMQMQAPPTASADLDTAWTVLTESPQQFAINGTLQMLDDCGAGLTWDHVDIYSGKAIKLGGNERVLRSVVLPYELYRSSYRYSLYKRIPS